MQTEEAATGLDAGVKVDVSALKSSMEALFNALVQTGGTVTDTADEVIRVVNEVGINTLVQQAREGSEEDMQILGLLYMVMRQAAAKGVQEAGKLVSTIARNLDDAGYTIESDCDCKR